MAGPSPRQRQSGSGRFTISLILGLLLIPLSAIAATALMSTDGGVGSDGGEAGALVVPVSDTTSTTDATAETVVVAEPPTATRADLETACGPEGLALVEREAAGTISDLEQAALDALRQICDEEGFELPGPPAPPPVVRTVSVIDTSAGASDDDEAGYDDDDDESDDHDDDDDEEDDDDDDHDDDDDDDDEDDENDEEDHEDDD